MRYIYIALLLAFISCKQESIKVKKQGLIAENAMVVTARVEASEVGLSILKQGGNAFDAMVATELALAVAFPFAGNIGGGGFMVYRTKDGEIGALDYREKAPLTAHRDMYLDSLGNVIPNKNSVGGTSVGVPGTIAGVFAAHEKFGSLPMQTILKPVIALAKKGVVVTQIQAKNLAISREKIREVSGENTLFSKKYEVGDTIKHIAFGKTLQKIQKNGKDEFYKGETAKIIVTFLQHNGSNITLEDLEKYEAKWREPVIFNFRDLKVISMSPPSSGGICLGQILKMIEPYNIASYGHNSEKAIQIITEAERRAYADRSFYLGDPDFVDVPTERLLENSYLKERMTSFSFEKATKSEDVSHGTLQITSESNETTHYSIVDSFGNAVSVTTTLNNAYGSKLYSEEIGMFFNNEMDDFSAKPGEPNSYGLIGAEANGIAPEKRMLSSMTPTIIEKDNKLWMVLGTPGGSTIITSVLQTILNVYEFNMTMQEAVDAPRFHHQWLPDEITFEPDSFSPDLIQKLENKGFKISQKNTSIIGSITAILVLKDGNYEAGADRRRDNKGVGF
ncbi:MAG: gamma-glutamyltransferase [Bacteroidetes bacterium HGW-Bacteroidetes-2]|jgi:gamma-glutamyltranspeptidase/glutathione hydrolase|nr:MAG: gamma-glutamyltransferase [Bacteroidetes bacterium HGW-Bacteroidetes-2]